MREAKRIATRVSSSAPGAKGRIGAPVAASTAIHPRSSAAWSWATLPARATAAPARAMRRRAEVDAARGTQKLYSQAPPMRPEREMVTRVRANPFNRAMTACPAS